MHKEKTVIIEPAGHGGICHYTYNLCQSLSKRNTSVSLITAETYELEDFHKDFNVSYVFNRYFTNPLNILKMIHHLKRLEPHAIHYQSTCHPSMDYMLISILKKFTKCKYIYTAHDILPHEVKPHHRFVLEKLYRSVDKIIVHSESLKHEFLSLFTVNPDNVVSIFHGNYMFFSNISKSTKKIALPSFWKNNHLYLLFFGNIRQYKGLIYLIRALPEVKKAIPHIKLLIVGKPRVDMSVYHEEIKTHGLESDIIFDLRYIPFNEVSMYFQIAEVVVLPYVKTYESGIVQIAYAFGKPVVATNTGALPETVENGKSGYIVSTRNSEELHKALITILNDNKKRKSMGAYAKHLINTKYSWDAIAKETETVYNDM